MGFFDANVVLAFGYLPSCVNHAASWQNTRFLQMTFIPVPKKNRDRANEGFL